MTDDAGAGEVTDLGLALTRRRADYDAHDLACSIHRLDTRVSVLETRMGIQDARLGDIEREIRDTNHCVQKVLQVLSDHVEKENRDRIKLMGAIIATLLSVVGFAGTILFNHLVK